MNCKQAEKLFIFRIENDLPTDQASSLDQHFNSCPVCPALYSRLKNTLEAVPSEKRNIPNAFLFTRIEAKLAETNNVTVQQRFKLIRALKPVTLALLVVLSLLLGFIVGLNNNKNENGQVSSGTEISRMAGYFEMGINHADTLENYLATK